MSQLSNSSSDGMRRIEALLGTIFPSSPERVELADGGISTTVYRIIFPNETFYLRMLPDTRKGFEPEVAVHVRLRQMGVKVPEVIHFERFNEIVQRSIMIITEIKGKPVAQSRELSEDEMRAIVTEAGCDLACINTIPVNGFGWINDRDEIDIARLQANYPTYRAYVLTNLDSAVSHLASHLLTAAEIRQFERVLARYDSWLDDEQSWLVHGDFSTRHIYQFEGRYTGIIDFSDMRGSSLRYDLGHFHMRDGGGVPVRLEAALLRGYQEVTSLPSMYEPRIRFSSVLLAVQLLGYGRATHPLDPVRQHVLDRLKEDLSMLL